MEAMGYLAGYYQQRDSCAVDLAVFDKSAKQADRESAVRNLQLALEAWKRMRGRIPCNTSSLCFTTG